MLAGDGEGLVDAADVGLLDGAGDRAVLRHLRHAREAARRARATTPSLVLTDSNRRQARRWTSVRDNLGVHRAAGRDAAQRRPERRAARRVPGRPTTRLDRRWTNAASSGPRRPATATRSPTRPRTPPRARSTATSRPRGGRSFGSGIGQKIRVVLDDPITTGRINLVQPQLDARDRYITKVEAPLRRQGHDRRRSRRLVAHTDGADVVVRLPDVPEFEIEVTRPQRRRSALARLLERRRLRRDPSPRRRHGQSRPGRPKSCACRPIFSARSGPARSTIRSSSS